MAIKYECPKCGRKFTEWGAEKLGFKCPHDEFCPADAPDNIELVRAGAGEDQMPKRSSLKRKSVRKPIPAPVAAVSHDEHEDDATDEPEVDEADAPDAIEGESDEGEDEALTEEADDVDDAEEEEEDDDDAAPGALPDAEDFDALPPAATPNNPLVPTDEDEWN